MTINFINRIGRDLPPPPPGVLIVCAGTITCRTVNEMKSGFLLFKRLFQTNRDWVSQLNLSLDNYHLHDEPMPSYQRIAQNENDQWGAVATVPVFHGSRGLGSSRLFASPEEKVAIFEKEYKQAVYEAVLDAKNSGRPLYIQPLGIGVYGWDSRVAAQLFAAAIKEADPNNEMTIHIPIYNQEPGSNDILFQRFLTEFLANRFAKPNEVIEPEPEIPLPDDNSEIKTKAGILDEILTTLIANIEQGKNDRLTDGRGSPKLERLREIKENLAGLGDVDDNAFAGYLRQTEAVCSIKRHWYHFWSTPHSLNEFHELLASKHLSLPEEEPQSEQGVSL